MVDTLLSSDVTLYRGAQRGFFHVHERPTWGEERCFFFKKIPGRLAPFHHTSTSVCKHDTQFSWKHLWKALQGDCFWMQVMSALTRA